MMLGPVMQDRSLLRKSEANRIRRCGLAAVVNRPRFGKEDAFPSRGPCAVTPVNIVSVHEQTFVEQTDFIEGLSTNHRETTDNDIDGQCSIVREVEHMFAGEKSRSPEYAFEAGCGTEVIPQSREPSACTLLRHVRVEHARTHVSDSWVLIEKIRKRIQAIRENDDIRIHQRNVTSAALTDGDIIPLRKSKVLGAPDEFHPGELY